jgi:8-amino-7-oxononanoate synthase
MTELEQRLAELEQLGVYRRLRLVSGPQGPRVVLDGKPVLLMCSNNYLSLADHPRLQEAAAEAAMRWGVGAGASRLVSGSMTIHRRLEERLAHFKGSESCVLFGSGYLANVGVIGALAGAGDVIFSDELNHASIVDGCRLSHAQVVVYRHCDSEHLEWCLRRQGGEAGSLIVTDSVFSMDADVAPLPEIVELAEIYGARVIVDEAHATGALGPGGRGAVAAAGLDGQVDVLVGTLGKALGSYGAYVCAEETTVQYLLNTARPLIFSTAPAPPAVAAAQAALELIESRPDRVERLRLAARTLRGALREEGFAVPASDMHIVPLVVGEERVGVRLSEAAIEQGLFVQAIRPPSVPEGTTRLRLTVMASHTATELRAVARLLSELATDQGLDPASIGSPELAAGRNDPYASSEGETLEPTAGETLTPTAGDALSLSVGEEALPLSEDDMPPAREGEVLQPTEEFDVVHDWEQEEQDVASGAADVATGPSAPFDLEREGGLREAA